MGKVLDRSGEPEPHLLDDVLAALRIDSSALYLFDFYGPWATNISDNPAPISWTLMEGTAWIVTPSGEAIQFTRGDTFLFPFGTKNRDYVLASSAELEPVPGRDLWRQVSLEEFTPGHRGAQPAHSCWGHSGPLTRVISSAFSFDDRQIGPLISALPELMVVRAGENDAKFIDAVLNYTLCGEDFGKPGFSVLATQAVQMLLVRMVRQYALSLGDNASGWLAGLSDPRIARALAAIHKQPQHAWTVTALARIAGMSRSLFAEHFVHRVGQSPIQYLRAWRIHLAREALANGDDTVARLAYDLGYQSEAAFREAFRRLSGQSPSVFRREAAVRMKA